MADEAGNEVTKNQEELENQLFLEAYATFMGLAIRSVRGALGLNQTEFSKNCHISARTLNKIESGVRSSDVTPLHKISTYLKRININISIRNEIMTISYPTDLYGGGYQDILYGIETDDFFKY